MGLTEIQITRALTEHPELFLQEGARRKLAWFVQYIRPNYQMTEFHTAYARILEMFARGKIRNLIIQAGPQHGKSELSSRMLPAYMLGMNPDLKIAICSYAATIAKDFNRDVQRLIDNDEYHKVFPDTCLNGSNVVTVANNYLRNSDVFEIVDHKGSLRVVGRGGSLTSKTVDVMIFDDLYKDAAEANSPVVRQTAWDWYTKVARTRLHNESQQLIVFTRWHPDDIIGKIIETENVIVAQSWVDFDNVPDGSWVLVNFEAIKTGAPTEIDPRDPGEALWPERHSLERLLQQREIDPVGFECLHQGNPGNAESKLYQPFKTWTEKGDWGSFVRSGCYVDVADEGSDYLAAVSYDIYRSDNQVWNERTKRFDPLLFALITDIEFTDESTEVTTVTVPRLINVNGVQKAWIESNNGGSQFEKNVKKKVRALTVPFYQGANKESRIVTNAPFVNQQIVMPFGWETRYPKAYAHLSGFLRNFAANKHDDMCFVAGTMIATPFGEKPIEAVRTGERVLTPLGPCRVIASGITGKRKVITKHGLTGTPNHKIFQQKRFDSLCVCYESLLSLCRYKETKLWTYKKLLFSMESPTDLWGRDGIISLNQIPMLGENIRKDFTRRFGSFIAERQYRKGIVFIIKTATLLITNLITWSVYRLANTCRTIVKKIFKTRNTSRKTERFCYRRKRRQKNGTAVRRDANGTANILWRLIRRQDTNKSVLSVAESSYHTKRKQTFVVTDVEKGIGRETCNIPGPVRSADGYLDTERASRHNPTVNFVQQVAGQDTQTSIETVYNLTVERANCYYANGILVSNCDALTGVYEKEIADGNTKPYGMASRGVKVH